MKTFTIDKLYHFLTTYGITLIGAMILKSFNMEIDRAIAISSLSALLIGTGKEVYDMYKKKTKLDVLDMLANFTGIVSAVLPTVLI